MGGGGDCCYQSLSTLTTDRLSFSGSLTVIVDFLEAQDVLTCTGGEGEIKEGKRRILGKGDEIGYGSGEAKEGKQGERRRRLEKIRL